MNFKTGLGLLGALAVGTMLLGANCGGTAAPTPTPVAKRCAYNAKDACAGGVKDKAACDGVGLDICAFTAQVGTAATATAAASADYKAATCLPATSEKATAAVKVKNEACAQYTTNSLCPAGCNWE